MFGFNVISWAGFSDKWLQDGSATTSKEMRRQRNIEFKAFII